MFRWIKLGSTYLFVLKLGVIVCLGDMNVVLYYFFVLWFVVF